MAEQPIIIKRIKKGHAAHHGGAWKVAYADFVTAMMAFFLLLWLLNAVTEEQLQGIADYFAPTTVSQSTSGAGGMLGGQTVGEGAMSSNGTTPSFSLSLPPPTIGQGGDALTDPKEGGAGEGEGRMQENGNGPQSGQGQGKDGNQTGGRSASAGDQAGGKAEALSEADIVKANAEREDKQFQKAQQALNQAINSIPELKKLADSLMVDNTPEGLRIQIVDQDGLAMFPKGSPDMYGHTHALVDLVARVVKMLPEKIAISGHTDATPFAGGESNYGNWELSADRALATRRALLGSGVPASRVERVVGRADTEPLMPNDAGNARNRRITVVLLRDTQQPGTLNVTKDAARSGHLPDDLTKSVPESALPPSPKPRE
jgi:chemotaxis protein MotB